MSPRIPRSDSSEFFENQEKLLTVEEIANRLNVSEKTIYGWTYRNKIPFIKIGKSLVRFDRKEIEQWLQRSSSHGN